MDQTALAALITGISGIIVALITTLGAQVLLSFRRRRGEITVSNPKPDGTEATDPTGAAQPADTQQPVPPSKGKPRMLVAILLAAVAIISGIIGAVLGYFLIAVKIPPDTIVTTNCEEYGFVPIPASQSGTVARSQDMGSGVTVTLEYGPLPGVRQGEWAKISGSTSPGDQVWMDWTQNGGKTTRLQCGPFLVDAAGQSKTSEAQATRNDPNWQFRACGKLAAGGGSKCTYWW